MNRLVISWCKVNPSGVAFIMLIAGLSSACGEWTKSSLSSRTKQVAEKPREERESDAKASSSDSNDDAISPALSLKWRAGADFDFEIPSWDMIDSAIVDPSGNLYLAVQGYRYGEHQFWSVIKYPVSDVTSPPDWEKTFYCNPGGVPGPGDTQNQLKWSQLALDKNGNLIFSGTCGVGPYERLVITKKFTADGKEDPAWDHRIEIAKDDKGYSRTFGYGLAIEPSGSVYLGGWTEVTTNSKNNYNAWIKKFGPNGREIINGWDKRVTGFVTSDSKVDIRGLAVDEMERLIVLFSESEETQPMTYRWSLKRYSSDGTDEESYQVKSGAAVRPSGMIRTADKGLLVGGSSTLLKIVSENDRLVTDWETELDASDISSFAGDSEGRTLVAGCNDVDSGLDSLGEAWVRLLSSEGESQEALNEATTGKIPEGLWGGCGIRTVTSAPGYHPYLITGAINAARAQSGPDVVIKKLSTVKMMPEVLGERTFSHKMLADDKAIRVTADRNGSVFVYGEGSAEVASSTLDGSTIGWLRKFKAGASSALAEWTVAVQKPSVEQPEGSGRWDITGLALDSKGRIVLQGYISNCSRAGVNAEPLCKNGYFFRRFLGTGARDPQFQKKIIFLPEQSYLGKFALDNKGHIYLSGLTLDASRESGAAWLKTFDANGNQATGGTQTLTTELNPIWASRLQFDREGNLLVGLFGESGFELIKYQANTNLEGGVGPELWRSTKPFSDRNQARGAGTKNIGVDDNGNVYVSYIEYVIESGTDDTDATPKSRLYIWKLDPAGEVVSKGWNKVIDLGHWGYHTVWAPQLCVAPEGSVYLKLAKDMRLKSNELGNHTYVVHAFSSAGEESSPIVIDDGKSTLTDISCPSNKAVYISGYRVNQKTKTSGFDHLLFGLGP